VSDDRHAETTRMLRYDAEKKSAIVAYLLLIFVGLLGVHRFYMGAWVSGLVMLGLTVVGFALSVVIVGYLPLLVVCVWWLVDLFLLAGMVKRHNLDLIDRMDVASGDMGRLPPS